MQEYLLYLFSVLLFVAGTYCLVFPESVKEYLRKDMFNQTNWQDKKYGDWGLRVIGIFFLFFAFMLLASFWKNIKLH
ncbi:MAG: hypothetical protein WA584_05120 [Pyrinomonadaceae bacterium]